MKDNSAEERYYTRFNVPMIFIIHTRKSPRTRDILYNETTGFLSSLSYNKQLWFITRSIQMLES